MENGQCQKGKKLSWAWDNKTEHSQVSSLDFTGEMVQKVFQ